MLNGNERGVAVKNSGVVAWCSGSDTCTKDEGVYQGGMPAKFHYSTLLIGPEAIY